MQGLSVLFDKDMSESQDTCLISECESNCELSFSTGGERERDGDGDRDNRVPEPRGWVIVMASDE